MPSLPRGSRSHYKKLLHVRHWTVGHNSSKEAISEPARAELLTCLQCSSPDRREYDTYDQVSLPSSSAPSVPYSLQRTTRAVPKYYSSRATPTSQAHPTCSFPEGNRICLRNRNSFQQEALSTILLPSDSSDSITGVLPAGRLQVTRETR